MRFRNSFFLCTLFVVVFPSILQGANRKFEPQPLTGLADNSPAQSGIDAQQMDQMPLAFTENRGQWDEQVLFRANSGGAIVWFCKDRIVYQFIRLISHDASSDPQGSSRLAFGLGLHDRFGHEKDLAEQLVVVAKFIGANPNLHVIGEGLMEYKCNYFLGNDPASWRTDVPNYRAVVFKNIYSGIDLRCSAGDNGKTGYDFGATTEQDLGQIKIEYEGVIALAVDESGQMLAKTAWGNMTTIVVSPTQGTGSDSPYLEPLAGGSLGFGEAGVSSKLAASSAVELDYSTFLGGSDDSDWGIGIAVDDSGCAYVTGYTYSSDFPTNNGYDESYSGSQRNVFVTKLSASGKALVYSTFLGGSDGESGYGIAVDASGCAFVTGDTYSSDFPMKNAYDASFNGYFTDAFVTKLSPSGNALAYSTYLGGSDSDEGCGIAVDNTGCACVTGMTLSTDFPTKNAYDAAFNGGFCDAFVTKFAASGNALVYSTYLGGSDYESGEGIAVDGSGCAYVAGGTQSLNFPKQNAYDATHNGGPEDVFVTKFSSAGNALLYSTYLGGPKNDFGCGISIDTFGCAYVTGWTNSSTFPTRGAYDASHNGGLYDVFVTKLSSGGKALVYSTFLGGSDTEYGQAIAVDASGCAFVTGIVYSSDFPTINAYDASFSGEYSGTYDAFVTKLSEGGNALDYSTYLGAPAYDCGEGIAVDGSGCAYVTGWTSSSSFPTRNAYDTGFNGGGFDAFVAKLSSGTQVSVIDEESEPILPDKLELSQNYPNPFNASTVIEYETQTAGPVTLDIYNILGQRIFEHQIETQAPGSHTFRWNGQDQTGADVPSGIYFYRVTTDGVTQSRKMVLLK